MRRPLMVGVLVIAIVAAGCQRDVSGDDPQASPDETSADTDTMTYVGPGARYNLELGADWSLNETDTVLVATPPGQSSPMVRSEVAEPRAALDIQAGIDELTADGDTDASLVQVRGALRAWRVDRSAMADGGIIMIVALSEAAVVTVAVAWTGDDRFSSADADRILRSLDLTRSDAGG